MVLSFTGIAASFASPISLLINPPQAVRRGEVGLHIRDDELELAVCGGLDQVGVDKPLARGRQ